MPFICPVVFRGLPENGPSHSLPGVGTYGGGVGKKDPEMTLSQSEISEAEMVTGEYGQEQLQLRFEKTAAKKFGQITGANIGKQLVAVANGKALIAPNIQQAIMGGSIVINAGITSMILYDKALADFLEDLSL